MSLYISMSVSVSAFVSVSVFVSMSMSVSVSVSESCMYIYQQTSCCFFGQTCVQSHGTGKLWLQRD